MARSETPVSSASQRHVIDVIATVSPCHVSRVTQRRALVSLPHVVCHGVACYVLHVTRSELPGLLPRLIRPLVTGAFTEPAHCVKAVALAAGSRPWGSPRGAAVLSGRHGGCLSHC